jgi:hypothetical protein
MATLTLKRLQCLEQEDWTGDDDIEIVVNGRAVWRNAMDTNQTRNLGDIAVEFTGTAQVKLMEKDWEGDDNLGNLTVSDGYSAAAERVATFTGDDAHYKLWFTVNAAASNVDDRTDEYDDCVCTEEDPYTPDPGASTDRPHDTPHQPCPMGAIAVTVTEPDGSAIEGATVTLREFAATKLTDVNGHCLFEGVLEGSVTVEARKQNFAPDPAGARTFARANQTIPVHLKLTTGNDCPVVIPNLNKTAFSESRAHFDLAVSNFVATFSTTREYIKGWCGSMVKLDNHVPAGTGGLLDGQIPWAGYRWSKTVAGVMKYWDGSAWQDVPAAALPIPDSHSINSGFYESTGAGGAKIFKGQYGGVWPEQFTDWNIDDPAKQAAIRAWEAKIREKWTGKFDLKRKECPSADNAHCRYSTAADSNYIKRDVFQSGMLIVADGNVRANDSLFFIGQRQETAPHEFGHHIGNPDEYAGAQVDTSLNGDGAVNGIDSTSVMGTSMNLVKKRHYRTICRHLANMVQTQKGINSTYEAVTP